MATQTCDFILDTFGVCLDMNDDVFDFLSDTNRGRQTKTEKAEKPNKSVQVRASLGESRLYPTAYSKA